MSNCESCSSCGTDDKDKLPPGMLKVYDLNKDISDGGLIFIETYGTDEIRVKDCSLELLAHMKKIIDGRIFGVIFGGVDIKPLYPKLFHYGVDTLYHVRGANTYDPEIWADSIIDVIERTRPSIVLMSATSRGRIIAPKVAAALSTGLTADCTGLDIVDDKLLMTRPALGGNILAQIMCDTYPQMATVRPGIFDILPDGEAKGTVIYRQAVIKRPPLSSESIIKDRYVDITHAKVLISLGNGATRRCVELAESICRITGVSLSCSRALVDKGWMPKHLQVGQSGRTVHPDVYIAIGISGSVQHMAGMSSSGYIISVNTDKDAPISEISDEMIVADAEMVLSELLEQYSDQTSL